MEKYWYCNVKIKGISTIYSYISDIGEISVENYVKVPFGQNNRHVVGKVMACEEYDAQSAPYPVEKTKHIICTAAVQEYMAQTPISSYYDDDDYDEIEEVEYYIGIGNWEEVLEWAYECEGAPDERITKKVIECYELCVEQGIPYAALYLGDIYYSGKLVEQDYQKAFELYKIAADAGILQAICNIGDFLYYGRLQYTDYNEAFRYYSIGATLFSDTECLYKLGDMYMKGHGVEINEKYAFLLYEKALKRCQENDTESECMADVQLRVGKCYLKGTGVKADIEQAHTLLIHALLGFYKRRKTDNFVIRQIESAKKLIVEAQELLEKETSNYQRRSECGFAD